MGVVRDKLDYLSGTKRLLREAINAVLAARGEPLLTESTPFEDYPSALWASSPVPSAGSLTGTVADKLLRLNETKNRLREAINAELGAGLVAGDSFRAYVDAVWTPLALFVQGEQGAWYDPSDLTTLYQDSAGTTPVTADGDPVGLMLDKSGLGFDAEQSLSASRGLYKTDGTLHWYEIDLVDDTLLAGIPDLGTNATLAYATDGGAVIVGGRSYVGPLALPDRQKLYAVVYLDRALTALEKSALTSYLNAKAGVFTETLAYGPGPQTLIAGDMTAGFFGEVSADELFRGDELALVVGVTQGVAQNSTAGWLKFAHNNKIKYIAKQTFRHTISWDHLYSRGIVYGTDDDGVAPSGTATNQFTTVDKGGSQFAVRLMTCASADPFPESDPLFWTADMHQMDIGGGSEWNELIYRVCADVPSDPLTDGMQADRHGGPQVGDNWAAYTTAELNIFIGNGRYTLGQEQSDFNSIYRVLRGNRDLASFDRGVSSFANGNFGWRPCLELIPNNGGQ